MGYTSRCFVLKLGLEWCLIGTYLHQGSIAPLNSGMVCNPDPYQNFTGSLLVHFQSSDWVLLKFIQYFWHNHQPTSMGENITSLGGNEGNYELTYAK